MVARLVRDQEAVGSNPVTSTTSKSWQRKALATIDRNGIDASLLAGDTVFGYAGHDLCGRLAQWKDHRRWNYQLSLFRPADICLHNDGRT